jgi:hypothetical protein
VDGSVRNEAADCAGHERLPRYCARSPSALDRLHELDLDPEHPLYESTKPGPGGSGSLIQTPLQLLDRLAALVPPRAFTATATSSCSRERPVMGNLNGNPERQELTDLRRMHLRTADVAVNICIRGQQRGRSR